MKALAGVVCVGLVLLVVPYQVVVCGLALLGVIAVYNLLTE